MRSAEHPRRSPAPNLALRSLLQETGWTQETLARAVTRTGTEVGLRLHYDRTSVAHWLRGSRPEPQVQRLMAEALSRRLGRPVTVTELGMGDGRSGGPGRRPAREADDAGHGRAADADATGLAAAHPVDRLAALTAPVVGPPRAAPPSPAPYRLTLVTDPPPAQTPSPGRPLLPPATGAYPHLLRPPRKALPAIPRGGRSARRTDPGEVASVHEHTRFFAQQADRYGGGHIRTSLAAYLSGLVRQLRAGGEGPHHAALLAGTARLGFLLARVYADEQRHGLAQRAFLTAAELAREGEDPEGVALAYRALSTQAHELGHRAQSLALAEAACRAAPPDAPPSARSFLYAGLAVAHAADGGSARATEALDRAERELARTPADLTTGPDSPLGEGAGAYQQAALLYQSSRVRARLGDPDGAVRDLRASLDVRPRGERRARAVSHAELAELLLAYGRLEEACAAWQIFLEDCAMVRSGRARRARDRMPRLLRPYAREQCVRALFTRAGAGHGPDGAPREHPANAR
ncbi:hypothetical protein [Streptomyces sp. HNM0574]|uniref:hypothetical protein n=1 Tax=Streptomyces sp. HNM0574 TaxID=2714954 RepID=UPI0019CF794C|nr:hypothetical protein [Streptomyces sp. HNM0574]